MTNKPMLSVERELRALAEKACGTAKDSPEYRRFLEAVSPTIVLDLIAEPAAQHQGEPVETVQQYRVVRHDPREQKYSRWYEIESDAKREQIANSLTLTGMSGAPAVYEIRTLYAEQSAPVAVVMPDRESFDIDDWAGSFCQEALSFGINQDVFARCVRAAISRTLAEVARLNGVKP